MKRLISAVLFFLPLIALADVESVGFLGVTGKDMTDAMKAAAGVEYGCLVEGVSDDSPAEKSGIAVGDILLQINDDKIKNFSEMRDIIEEMPDQKVSIVILHAGEKTTKSVTLGHREKNKMKFEIDIPDFSEIKEVLNRSDEALKKQIAELKAEMEKLKQEMEILRNRLDQKK